MRAIDLAQYIIAKSDNVGDLITNKKLQKVLYYVKAWGLVYFTDGIIDDSFEAWIHGPVCPAVYINYKPFGYKAISIEYNGKSSSEFIKSFKQKHIITQRDADKFRLLDAVFRKYASHTSLELELLTHSEEPWIEARRGLSPTETGHAEIKESTMEKFYASKLNEKVQKL